LAAEKHLPSDRDFEPAGEVEYKTANIPSAHRECNCIPQRGVEVQARQAGAASTPVVCCTPAANKPEEEQAAVYKPEPEPVPVQQPGLELSAVVVVVVAAVQAEPAAQPELWEEATRNCPAMSQW